jgi:hypothetical protein
MNMNVKLCLSVTSPSLPFLSFPFLPWEWDDDIFVLFLIHKKCKSNT